VLHVPWSDYIPTLWTALLVTVKLTVTSFVGACVIGMFAAILRQSKASALRSIAYLYTEVFKNVPMVTGIFIIYFGLAEVGLVLGGFEAGFIALAVFYGAYLAEIFRGGLQGIGRGQLEAAQALGLTPARVLVTVHVPQAIRLALPGTSTMLIDLLKGTSLLVTIGGGELMTQATVIAGVTFQPLEVYVVVGLIYLAMCWPLARLVGVLEGHLQRGTALSPTSRRIRRLAAARLAEGVS
jgi:polar amino acid transport system permease protein